MKLTEKNIMLAVLLVCCAQAPLAQAADESSKAQFTLGVKLWNSSWSTYNPGIYTGVTAGGQPGLADSIDAVEGERKTDAIPVLAVRKGNYVVSFTQARYASNFHSPHSSVIGPDGSNILTSRTDHLQRKETDLTAAYFVIPNLALSAGLKYAAEERDTATAISAPSRLLNAKGKAIIFGALASFPVKDGMSVYGQLGAGPTRLTTTLADGSGADTSTGRYLSSELGISYALRMADPFVKGLYLGLGYRSQTITTPGISPGYGDSRKFRDVKDGVVFSLTAAL